MLRTLLLGWLSHMQQGLRGLSNCPSRDRDERGLCAPSMSAGIISPAEAATIVAAAESAAAALGGYTHTRHKHFSTRDLPLEAVYARGGSAAAEAAAKKAIDATARAVVARCGAEEPVLVDGFVIKYAADAGQSALGQHADGGRYSSTVALNPPRRAGVAVPAYAALPPQTCPRRAAGDPRATCVDPAAHPERRFANESFDFAHPLWEYEGSIRQRGLCPPTCAGETCDALLAVHTRADLERRGCDCATCARFAELGGPRAGEDYFDGGGTRFSSLRDATFFPDVGGAVVHGARLKHGAEAVTGGDRFVLAFFFDERRCADAEAAFDTFATSLVVAAVVPVVLYIAFVAEF